MAACRTLVGVILRCLFVESVTHGQDPEAQFEIENLEFVMRTERPGEGIPVDRFDHVICPGELVVTRSQLNPNKTGQYGLYLRPVSVQKKEGIGQSHCSHESKSHTLVCL
jgi:hypothetical protein